MDTPIEDNSTNWIEFCRRTIGDDSGIFTGERADTHYERDTIGFRENVRGMRMIPSSDTIRAALAVYDREQLNPQTMMVNGRTLVEYYANSLGHMR